MKGARVFSSFLKEIIRTKSLQTSHFSNNKIIQSSVGVIFKCMTENSDNSIESIVKSWKEIKDVGLLMVQRAGFETDANAYNVVFPGGQADPGQSDIQACKRELIEQVNLNVDQECMYVGQIPKNFYYAKKRGKFVYISCHVWIMKPKSTYQPKLNEDQLIDYRWVPLQQLISPQSLTLYSQKQLGFFSRMGVNIVKDNIKKNLQNVQFPGMSVGLKRDLWGLTLWLLGYILQMAKFNIVQNPQDVSDETIVKKIDIITDRIKMLTIKFKRSYIVGYPMIWMAKTWHYYNRVKPFSYTKPKWEYSKPLAFAVSILVLILIAIMIPS